MANSQSEDFDIFEDAGLFLAIACGNAEVISEYMKYKGYTDEQGITLFGFELPNPILYIGSKISEVAIKNQFENIKKKIFPTDPVKIPTTERKYSVHRGLVNIETVLRNFKAYGLQETNLDYLDVNAETTSEAWVKFIFTIPLFKLTCDFSVKGDIIGTKIDSKGEVYFTAKNYKIRDGKLKTTYPKIDIKVLEFDISYDSFLVTQKGLKIEGMNDAELNKLMNETLAKHLIEKRKEICTELANIMKNEINKEVRGK